MRSLWEPTLKGGHLETDLLMLDELRIKHIVTGNIFVGCKMMIKFMIYESVTTKQ